jgi:transposase
MSEDRFEHRDDHSDVTKPVRPQRIEVITGAEGRRRWSRDKKLAIVTESFRSDGTVAEIARRHRISPPQLFGWRAQFRAELEAPPQIEAPMFAPAISDASLSARTGGGETAELSSAMPLIEITLGTAVVRVRGSADPKTLRLILEALKVSR